MSPAATTPAPAATAAKFHDPVAAAPVLEVGAALPPLVVGSLAPVELSPVPVLLGAAPPPVEEGAEVPVEEGAEVSVDDDPPVGAAVSEEEFSVEEAAVEDAAVEDSAAEEPPPLPGAPAATSLQISAVRLRTAGGGLAVVLLLESEGVEWGGGRTGKISGLAGRGNTGRGGVVDGVVGGTALAGVVCFVVRQYAVCLLLCSCPSFMRAR